MQSVVVLNSSYEYLNSISWQKAITLLYKGKVEVVKNTDRVIRNFENTVRIFVPKIVRLLKYVRTIFKKAVYFSKRNIHCRDNWTCQYCDSKTNIGIDHIIPLSKGGKSTWENCVSCCKKCNKQKGYKSIREAKMFLKRQPFQPTINEFMHLKLKQRGFDLEKLLEEISTI